jgi:hypothetical protein
VQKPPRTPALAATATEDATEDPDADAAVDDDAKL